MLVLFASVFSKGRKPGSWSMPLGSSESIDASKPEQPQNVSIQHFFSIFCRKKIDYDTLHSVLMWASKEMKDEEVLPNKPLVSNLLRSLRRRKHGFWSTRSIAFIPKNSRSCECPYFPGRPKSHSSEISRAMQLVESVQQQVWHCTVLTANCVGQSRRKHLAINC